MVSGIKTEMPCCYPHKTSNITGNGAETGDRRRRPPIEHEADGSREPSVGQAEREGERESVSVKESLSDRSCEI